MSAGLVSPPKQSLDWRLTHLLCGGARHVLHAGAGHVCGTTCCKDLSGTTCSKVPDTCLASMGHWTSVMRLGRWTSVLCHSGVQHLTGQAHLVWNGALLPCLAPGETRSALHRLVSPCGPYVTVVVRTGSPAWSSPGSVFRPDPV